MVGAAVSYVLKKLADAVLEKAWERLGVHGKIEQMKKELCLIKALIKDSDSKHIRNGLVIVWLNQVREIANTIATVIDTFRVEIEETNSPESSNCGRKFMTGVKRTYNMYSLGGELDDITQNLNRILQRSTQLGVKDLIALEDVDDPEVVGLEDDKDKVIEQQLDSSISRRTGLPIVGTSGLRKTTRPQKVYKSLFSSETVILLLGDYQPELFASTSMCFPSKAGWSLIFKSTLQCVFLQEQAGA